MGDYLCLLVAKSLVISYIVIIMLVLYAVLHIQQWQMADAGGMRRCFPTGTQ